MPITTISGELYLDGDVGDCGFPDYFTAKEVAQSLAGLPKGKPAKVRLNSGGGIATEGMAIAAAFNPHPPGVYATIAGIAASAAPAAACAAARCTIAFGSIYMIHEASGFSVGTAETHRETIATLETLNDAMAQTYAAKTRQSVPAMRELMRIETWMLAEDAVARGFCDAVVGAPGAHPAMARFDYTKYRHPPAALKAQALAGRRGAAEDKAQRETWAAIAEMCIAKGRTDMTARLIEANVSLAEATKRVQAEASRAYARRGMAKLAGLTTAEVDAQRAARGMKPVTW